MHVPGFQVNVRQPDDRKLPETSKNLRPVFGPQEKRNGFSNARTGNVGGGIGVSFVSNYSSRIRILSLQIKPYYKYV